MDEQTNQQRKKKKLRVLKTPLSAGVPLGGEGEAVPETLAYSSVVSNCRIEKKVGGVSFEPSDEYKKKLQELQDNWINKLSLGDEGQDRGPVKEDDFLLDDDLSGTKDIPHDPYCQWCEPRQNVEVRRLTMFAESQPERTDSAESIQHVVDLCEGDEFEEFLRKEFERMITEIKEVLDRNMKEIMKKMKEHIKDS